MTGLPLGDMPALRRAAARLHDTEMPPQAHGLVIGWIDPLITYIDHLERELDRARAGQATPAEPAASGQHRPRLFALHRRTDVTGVSGTGTVAYGAQFADGTVAVRWLGDKPSLVVWKSIHDALAVHGHDGATRVVWLTGSPPGPAETEAALHRLARAAGAFLPLIPGGDDEAEAELRAAIAAIPAADLPPSADTTTGTKT